MKKISLLVIFSLLTISLFAQAETKETAEISDDLFAIRTANNLARYGYANESASALIGAAEIYARLQTQPMSGSPTSSSEAAPGAVETPEFTPENLLRDARRFAGRDRNMTGWADEVQKTLNRRTRGAVGGPKYTSAIINGNSTHTWYFDTRGGERTEILMVGNGATDLDLYVYDSAGNLIVADDNYTDIGHVWIYSPRQQTITVVVRNLGSRANLYELATD